MAAEIIREKLFLSLKQELPYYTAVEIEKWEDKTSSKSQDPLTIIHAVVYVGRTSHKGMVIGKGGAKLKEISTASRKDIEELLGHKVFLEDGQSIDFGEEPGEDFDPSLLPSMFAEHLQEEHSPEPPVALPKVKNKLKK